MMQPLEFDTLVTLVGKERLAPYLSEVGDSERLAAELCAWNVEIGGALWHLVAHVEVAARNAMSRELSALRRRSAPRARWYNERRVFTRSQRSSIGEAKRAVRIEGLTDGRVIAQLHFGFWVSLLDPGHEHSLWVPALRRAFPFSPGRRSVVRGRMGDANRLRNDIAHHNRIWKGRQLERSEEELLGLAYWIDPRLADYLQVTSTVRKVAASRPRLPPSQRWART